MREVEINKIKQFFAGFDYKQLVEIEKIVVQMKNIKYRDFAELEKEKYKESKVQRAANERYKRDDFFPSVRRFCRERLRKGDIIKCYGNNSYHRVNEITSTTIIGTQVRMQEGVPIDMGYYFEDNFDKLEGVIRDKKFIHVKELIKE